MITNPFLTTSVIPDKYFCDREEETEKLVRYLTNGNNVVLKSPRRIGKSGLIHHVLSRPIITRTYNTVYVDIYATKSIDDLAALLWDKVHESAISGGGKLLDLFRNTVKAIRPSTSFDPVTGLPVFSIGFDPIQDPDKTLGEIFSFLEKTSRPNIIAFDEFQQVGKYKDGSAEAILRSHIQGMNNTVFIFSGSERHLLDNMFGSSAKPFYNSAMSLPLDVIGIETYCRFAEKSFKREGRELDPASVKFVYKLFDGYTYYLQVVMNLMFSVTPQRGKADCSTAEDAIREVLASKDEDYKKVLLGLTEIERKLLYAVAMEGQANKITSSEFISKYHMGNSSRVQKAAESLMKESKQYISRNGSKYMLSDRFMELWLAENYGEGLLRKFAAAGKDLSLP